MSIGRAFTFLLRFYGGKKMTCDIVKWKYNTIAHSLQKVSPVQNDFDHGKTTSFRNSSGTILSEICISLPPIIYYGYSSILVILIKFVLSHP